MNILASELKAGDRVDYYGRGLATILRDAEPDTDPFGRRGFFKFWAKSDDGREGWLKFGPSGRINRAD